MTTGMQKANVLFDGQNKNGESKLCRHPTIFLMGLLLSMLSLLSVGSVANADTQFPLQNQFKNVDTELRAKIAQKLFLDLRYYCAPKVNGYCQEPMLELPDELTTMLAKSKVGGVILFGENLSSAQQIVKLTHDLQSALKPAVNVKTPLPSPSQNDKVQSTLSISEQKVEGIQAKRKAVVAKLSKSDTKQLANATPLYVPLYIGIDQEGGRVSRLPQSEFIGFAGNMAIGATAKANKNAFAVATSLATAKHLNILGINVNFAPVLDVNNNPSNPIINVRAYSQYPSVVSDLGGAAIKTMQNQNISVAAKHFPGHGDTFMDSHVGLPRVDHSRDVINSIDLLPFRHVIGSANSRPDMIMTAHIQYPALDNTPFVSQKGVTSNAQVDAAVKPDFAPVLPATLSKKILTGILREELAYDGLIITDALDMRAITQYLTPIEAVIQSFSAGADITLMPYHISSPQDAIGFLDWLNELTIFIAQDVELTALVEASYNRIIAHKAKRNIAKRTLLPLSDKLALLDNNSYHATDRSLATELSQASFTSIKAPATPLLATQRLLVIMPDKLRCQAFEHYWQKQVDSGAMRCLSLLSESIFESDSSLGDVDALIVGESFPQLAFYESNKVERISAHERLDNIQQQKKVNALVAQAKSLGIPRLLVKLRSPYISVDEATMYTGIFASYDYQVIQSSELESAEESMLFSPAFSSMVSVLTGERVAKGRLPVSLAPEVVELLASFKVKKEPRLKDIEQ